MVDKIDTYHRAPLGANILLALGLALGPAEALGFARFAYALLLPAMRTDLGWSYAVAGAMNTANAIGYLVGALIAAPVMQQRGLRWTFHWSMLLTAFALLGSSIPTAEIWLLALRAVAGVSGALTFIAGGALAAQLTMHHSERAGLLLGIYFGGGGFGILLSGLIVPLLIRNEALWRWGWIGLGTAAFVATLISWRTTPSLPVAQVQAGTPRGWPRHLFVGSFAAYLLFACGYIAYMTFVIALLREQAMTTIEVVVFWCVLGSAAMIAPHVWGRRLSIMGGGRTLAAVLLVVATGAALPIVSSTLPMMLLSAAIFGVSFLVVPTAITALVRQSLPSEAWPSGIAVFTVVFAAGQILGPLISGALADVAGGLQASLGFSAALLFLGALAALGQRMVRV